MITRDRLTEIYNNHFKIHPNCDFEVCGQHPCQMVNNIESAFTLDWIWDEYEDPFFKFEQWCVDNGFADVALCEVENVDMDRLHLAIEVYGKTGESNERME